VGDLQGAAELAALELDDLPADHHDGRLLAEARQELATARDELWVAPDLAFIRDHGTLATIGRAQTLMEGLGREAAADRRLASAPSSTSASDATGLAIPAGERSAPAGGSGRRVDPEPVVAELSTEPSPLALALDRRRPLPGRARTRLDVTHRRRQLLVAALAGVAAVWSGLTYVYADAPFGTPTDYLQIFAWGLLAQAVLVTLAAAADKLVFDPAPAPTPGP
jgi:hypothetical protein